MESESVFGIQLDAACYMGKMLEVRDSNLFI